MSLLSISLLNAVNQDIKQKIIEKYQPSENTCRLSMNPDTEVQDSINHQLACVVFGYKPLFRGSKSDLGVLDPLFSSFKDLKLEVMYYSKFNPDNMIIHKSDSRDSIRSAFILAKYHLELELATYFASLSPDQFTTTMHPYIDGILSGYSKEDLSYSLLLFVFADTLSQEEARKVNRNPVKKTWDIVTQNKFDNFVKNNENINNVLQKMEKKDLAWLKKNQRYRTKALKSWVKKTQMVQTMFRSHQIQMDVKK